MGKNGFQDLTVWQKGRELAVLVYRITASEPFSRDPSFRDQVRRAAISIPSNIAEGDERETDKEAVRFFYIAKGSAAELLTHAIVASDIGYIRQSELEEIKSRSSEILRMLANLIKARSKSPKSNPLSAN
jgi:four helix bundle protein